MRVTPDTAPWRDASDVKVIHGDSITELPKIRDKVGLVYIDPPFNTGKQMSYTKTKATQDDNGDRKGYLGRSYKTEVVSELSYNDNIDDYVNFIAERVKLARALLAPNGSFFLHVDYREVHYLKVALDKIFGRDNFINEIIWSYDFGGRSKTRWSCKHDTILWYAANKNDYVFNYDSIDRIPYLAPGLVGEEKAQRGKTPTDVWWNTIVGTNSRERKSGAGYPTQKPLAILERIILVHSNPGDTVLDFFAGSGTTGVAAVKHGRKAILIDSNPQAIDIIRARVGSAAAWRSAPPLT